MRSRRARLTPPPPQFLDEMYRLAAANEVPWQWRGTGETVEAFQRSLVEDVLVNFMIEDVRTGQGAGFLSAYNHSPFHGYCYVTVMLHPAFRLRGWPLEGVILLGNYLFTKFNLRNIYLQTTGAHLAQFKSGIGVGFEVEGQLKDRLLINGQPEDLVILTVSRERWFSTNVVALERITRRTSDPA